MVAHGYDDCEGDLIKMIREISGPDIKIGALLDPHCHMTDTMLENATALICLKEYPHVDSVARSKDLFNLLADAARSKTSPVSSAQN